MNKNDLLKAQFFEEKKKNLDANETINNCQDNKDFNITNPDIFLKYLNHDNPNINFEVKIDINIDIIPDSELCNEDNIIIGKDKEFLELEKNIFHLLNLQNIGHIILNNNLVIDNQINLNQLNIYKGTPKLFVKNQNNNTSKKEQEITKNNHINLINAKKVENSYKNYLKISTPDDLQIEKDFFFKTNNDNLFQDAEKITSPKILVIKNFQNDNYLSNDPSHKKKNNENVKKIQILPPQNEVEKKKDDYEPLKNEFCLLKHNLFSEKLEENLNDRSLINCQQEFDSKPKENYLFQLPLFVTKLKYHYFNKNHTKKEFFYVFKKEKLEINKDGSYDLIEILDLSNKK